MFINTAQYDVNNPAGTTTRTSETTVKPKTPDTFAAPRQGPQVDAFTKGGAEGYAGLMGGFNDLEAANYKTSGYADIYNDPTLGMVPQATMDAYWNPAIAEAEKKAKGAYASIYGESGNAPSGVGSQVQSLTDMSRQMETQRAGAYMENAATGAKTQAAAKQSISGNRYKVLSDPVDAYYKLQQGEGARLERFPGQSGGETTTMTQVSPLGGGGTTQRTGTGTNGAGTSTVGAAQRPVATGSTGAGAAPLVGQSAVTVQQPDYWGRSSSDPNYGQMPETNPYGPYNPNDLYGQNAGANVDTSVPYTDPWNEPGYPGGPNENPYGPYNPNDMYGQNAGPGAEQQVPTPTALPAQGPIGSWATPNMFQKPSPYQQVYGGDSGY